MEKKLYEWQVPHYDVLEFNEKSNEYCCLIFVINEGNKLLAQLNRMKDVTKNCVDIIIADGGSSDGSTDGVILEENNVNALLVKKGEGKLGSQMRIGFAWALERGYKGVIVIDGNNKDSVNNIPDFVNKLEQGYDHVQGSRFIPGGHHENTPISRLLGLKLIHVPLMRLSSGFKYTDTTNGFRAYSSRLLSSDKLAIFRDVFTGYELHYYLAIKAATEGFKCIEIPVSRVYPSSGKTPTKISPLKGNMQVIHRLLSVCFGKYNR